MNRRQAIGRTLGSVAAASLLPAWARSNTADLAGQRMLAGREFDLEVAAARVSIDGRRGKAVLVNGQLPAPLLRWREGHTLTLRVRNELSTDTSIHWHGILLPFYMDGVPGLTFPGIRPGRTFEYTFSLQQAGTYWYHSHSGLQEQMGHYGPIIIEPRDGYAEPFDREYVVLLSDWTFEDPHRVFAKLKKMSHNYNFQQRTVGDFFRDANRRGMEAALSERQMWGAMRMNPTDIADVTGSTYTYLVNGHGPEDNWTGLFRPGERVRLRFINASAMSIFNVRIPGLPMRVVAADGLDVRPVDTEEFQIGVAETFDVIVTPPDERAYTIVAESNDRSGMGRATLAPRPGMQGAIPPLRRRPTLTMKDMGMDHGAMGHGADGMNHSAMGHGDAGTTDHSAMVRGDTGGKDHSAMGHGSAGNRDHSAMAHGDAGGMDHAAMGHGSGAGTHHAPGHGRMAAEQGSAAGDAVAPAEHVVRTVERPDVRVGAGVVNVAENPVSRLHERPLGLGNEPHRVLVYTDLESRLPNPDTRPPGREIELHLTSNMERYMWSFDGIKFSEVDGPIVFHEGERLRLTMVNDTMMPHPIHLHGMFFDVVTAEHAHKPRKHTIVVKPAEKLSVDITADAVGDWAFHCHLLYHMHAGMMRVVSVRPRHPA